VGQGKFTIRKVPKHRLTADKRFRYALPKLPLRHFFYPLLDDTTH